MPLSPSLAQQLLRYVDDHRNRLTNIVSDIVRIPSENTPPSGSEAGCQEYLARRLRGAGWTPQLYELADVPGLREHPLFWGDRRYAGRPNLGARKSGAGGGRSLVLSGHIDTVPQGTQNWTRDPFSGDIDGNRLYGRGSNDMKGGVATNLFVVEAIEALGVRLTGDLIFETVIDEEFGGVNGTLAGRLMGFNADAAIISEPSFLRICPAQRGGRTVHITFRAAGGVLTDGKLPAGVIDQLTFFLGELPNFAAQRRAGAHVHEMYSHHVDPVPVSITKIVTSPWGTREPITLPEECRVEMYWQLMPGERQEDVEREFFTWFDGWFDALLARSRELSATKPAIEFPIRWMPGSAISKAEPLVATLADAARLVLGREPIIAGIEGPCDMYVFHQAFGIPAVLWGARGGNTHAADEFVEIDSLVDAAKTLLLFICDWCGMAQE